jgi:predicted Zn-ribbon and HTH transcriptional regulator
MDQEEIFSIKTIYKGVTFRSTTEARWAVFFDACGLKWMYEPFRMNLGKNGSYLPDFYLPEIELFIEVKGEWEKDPERPEKKCASLCDATLMKVYLVWGNMPTQPEECMDDLRNVVFIPHEHMSCGSDLNYIFCECSTCHRIGFEFNGRTDRMKCKSHCPKSEHGDKGYNYDSPKLKSAYVIASKHQFL